MKRVWLYICVILGLCMGAYAANGRETLNHYGLVTLGNASVEHELAGRFKGSGKPVFLVHDLKLGIAPGDVVRFSDKAVLVDAAVLQTLQATGALKAANQAAVLRLQARAQSGIWKGRTGMVSSGREKKGYALGSELLKIFEDYFGGVPTGEELVIRFEGRDMVLMLPNAMLDRMAFAQVRKVGPSSKPVVVSLPPASRFFRKDTLYWQVWGADPGEPESQLSYGILGDLPQGLHWDAEAHALYGRLEADGAYALKVWTRNPGGASDTLAFQMEVRENAVPSLAVSELPPLRPGEPWRVLLRPFDRDHAVELLRCEASDLPSGWALDGDSCALSLDSAGVPETETPTVTVRVCDPLGACGEYDLRVMALAPLLSRLSAVRLVLPVDSLMQGQKRRWVVRDLLSPGIRLLGVSGMDSSALDSLGDTLTLMPLKAGDFSLGFVVGEGPDTQTVVQTLHVAENRPPRFLSSLSTYSVQEGERLAYAPVAVDEDGDSLAYGLRMADGRVIRYQGGEIVLWTASPGLFTLEFSVSDGLHGPVTQRIAYEVLPRRAEWKGAGMRFRSLGPVQSWWAYWRFGGARVGLFTPKLGEATDLTLDGDKEWPYVFAGASFVGDRALSAGSWLWADMGLQLRRPAKEVWTGAFMFNVEGRYASRDKKYPWAFEGELSVHANQAILVVDTSGWANMDYTVLMDEYKREFGIEDLNADSVLKRYLGSSYDKLKRDLTARDNVVASLRLETWVPLLGMGLAGDMLLAPVYWREDYILRAEGYQLFGLGLRHQASWGPVGLTHSLRAGTGSDGMRLWYDLHLLLGRWL